LPTGFFTGPKTVARLALLYSNYFTTSPDGRAGGRLGGRVLEEMKLRQIQPSIFELELGLSLAIFRDTLVMQGIQGNTGEYMRYTEVNTGKLEQTFGNLGKFRKTKVRR
jgi:hypothetical protein